MSFTQNDIELEDGEINDLEDGEIEDDEILPKERRSPVGNMPPQDRGNRTFPLDEPRYPRRRDEERVVGHIYEQPSYRQHLPIPSIPRQADRFVNFRGRGRGFMNPRGRGRPSFPDRGRGTFGRERMQRGVPRIPAPPRIRSPSPPKKPQGTEYEEKEDFEMLLERHKLIQQQLESLERQERAALESDIDDSFIDIPVGDDELVPVSGSGGELDAQPGGGKELTDDFINQIDQTLSMIRKISADEAQDQIAKEQQESKPFEPFKIKPRYPTIPSLQERSKIDIQTRKGDQHTQLDPRGSDNLQAEPEQDKNEGDHRKSSNNSTAERGTDQEQRMRRRRHRRSSRSKKVVSKQQSQKQLPSANKPASPVDAHSELDARLVALASMEVPSEVISRRKEPERKVEIVDKQKKRREKVREWQQRKDQRYHQKAEQGGKISGRKGVASLDEYKHDDYLEMPMDVESDSADGPALPLIEEPAEGYPPPPPPREAALSYAFMTEQGIHETQLGHESNLPAYPVQMMQGGYDPYMPDPQTYPGWMNAGPLPVPFQDSRQVFVGPESVSPSKQTTEGVPAKPESDNDEDDDEVKLRQLLLKSMMAKKKKAGQNQDSKPVSTSAQSTPRSQSPVTATAGNDSTKPTKGPGKPIQKVMFAPPKHDEVVINLGEDSDSENSDEEKPKTATTGSTSTSGKGQLSGGLFGGLEMMIKETRKSVEASRVTPANKEETKIPPEPKTPDAMQHMPEDRKEEYRRLKEQLALHEKKKRQPLSTVNQDKDDADKEQTPEANHLTVLQNQVRECEVAMIKHRKILEQDELLLSTVLKRLTEKTSMLETQEAQVKKLKQQLQAAQGVTIANRVLIKKLKEQSKTIKERVVKKLPVAGEVEEELLRSKTLLSIANKTGTTQSEKERGSEGGGNENRVVFSPATVQEMATSLEAKLKKLNEITKSEKSSLNKRKLEDADKEEAKKSRTDKASLGSSASSTPKKSAVTERIAAEKARLKKLEQQLTEKLKQFGKETQSKESSYEDGKQDAGQIDNNNTVTSRGENVDKANAHVSETKSAKVQESHEKMEVCVSEADNVGGSGIKAGGAELDVNTKQRDYVKMLQSDKEKKGPPFPHSILRVPLAVHHLSSGCVWLQPTKQLEALESADLTWADLLEGVHGNALKSPSDATAEDEMRSYRSPLLYFKSYRLSSYFRLREELSLSSLSYSNKVHPMCPLCKFDLNGVCNDEQCRLQHFSQCKPTKDEILQDVAAYDPHLFQNGRDPEKIKERVVSFTNSFAKQYQDKMTWDELCLLLVNRVKESRKLKGPFSICHKARPWRPEQSVKEFREPEQDETEDRGRGVVFSSKQNKRSLSRLPGYLHGEESQEVRYFSEEYNSVKALEEALQETPDNVTLWIKLARRKLHCKETEGDKTDEELSNIVQALNSLSTGLEANPNSEELWLEYLELFSTQSTYEELKDVCEQAVTYSSTYHVWRKYLDLSVTYAEKRAICIRVLAFFSENPDTNDEALNSHHLLDRLLFLVQLDSYSGRHKTALSDLQGALGRKKHYSVGDVGDLTSLLTPSDLCFAWLSYIHVFEFHRLPASWFDPACSRPSSIVCKDEFIFSWQPGEGTRAPDDKLLGMFQDALKVCRKRTKVPADRLNVCMPLYKNLIALERAHNRVASAKGICQHLLREAPRRNELWLCLAALAEVTEMEPAQVYAKGLWSCGGHAEIAYSFARFHLSQSNGAEAVSELVKCADSKFTANPDEEIASLPDPLALYRKLLSQPLPYDYKCPPLAQGVVPKNLGTEEMYLWLCYCLLLELSPNAAGATVDSVYETVLHSMLNQKERQLIWLEYLSYQRSSVVQAEASCLASRVKVMEELVNRCLISESSSSSLPYSTAVFWHDYTFHNQVISLYLSCLPKSVWSAAFDKLLSSFPNNVNLALRASQHELDMKQIEKAKRICLDFLAENPSNITMWKVLIAIQLQRGCVKEARKLYQQATEALPFAATLWKDFAMFELSRGDDTAAVKEIEKKCQDIGVDIAEFLATLTGK